jgi:cation transport ATPase
MTAQKQNAIDLLQKGNSYIETSNITGVSISTLRTWKSRDKHNSNPTQHITDITNVTKHNSTVKTEHNTSDTEIDTTLQKLQVENEALHTEIAEIKSVYNGLCDKYVASRNEAIHTETALHEYKTELHNMTNITDELQNEIETLHQTITEHNSPNDIPLIISIVALHVSAIYGVGEMLTMLLGTWFMGYLTATVFVSAGLVMFISKRFSNWVSFIILVSTFIAESFCNYLTIRTHLKVDFYNQLNHYTNPFYLFFVVSVFIPLTNLLLEYILFNKNDDQ